MHRNERGRRREVHRSVDSERLVMQIFSCSFCSFCSFFSTYYPISYFCKWVLLVPPKWTVEPEDTNVIMGNPCMLHCQADGYPTPAVVWKKSFGMF